jgi:hypothetical protein
MTRSHTTKDRLTYKKPKGTQKINVIVYFYHMRVWPSQTNIINLQWCLLTSSHRAGVRLTARQGFRIWPDLSMSEELQAWIWRINFYLIMHDNYLQATAGGPRYLRSTEHVESDVRVWKLTGEIWLGLCWSQTQTSVCRCQVAVGTVIADLTCSIVSCRFTSWHNISEWFW